MDVTEAKDIKKRWQVYTEELYKKKILMTQITMMVCSLVSQTPGMWSQMGLRKHHAVNKASGGDGIPVELFQILKDDAVKVLHTIYQQIRKIICGSKTGKGQFSFQSQKSNGKECSNYLTIALISHTSKVMLKNLQARL